MEKTALKWLIFTLSDWLVSLSDWDFHRIGAVKQFSELAIYTYKTHIPYMGPGPCKVYVFCMYVCIYTCMYMCIYLVPGTRYQVPDLSFVWRFRPDLFFRLFDILGYISPK